MQTPYFTCKSALLFVLAMHSTAPVSEFLDHQQDILPHNGEGYGEEKLLQIAELKRRYSALVIQLDRLRPMMLKADSKNPKSYKWSIREIVGHLIDVDRDIWGPRIERTLSEDVPYFENIDQDELVRKHGWNEIPLEDIIAQLMRVRWNLAVFINNLPDASLARTCHHFSAGILSVADILQILVDHDAHHLEQIRLLV